MGFGEESGNDVLWQAGPTRLRTCGCQLLWALRFRRAPRLGSFCPGPLPPLCILTAADVDHLAEFPP